MRASTVAKWVCPLLPLAGIHVRCSLLHQVSFAFSIQVIIGTDAAAMITALTAANTVVCCHLVVHVHAACSAVNPTAEDSSVVLPSNTAWTCTGQSHGAVCTATCSSGYHAQTATSWKSTCSLGRWGVPAYAAAGDTKLVCEPNGELDYCYSSASETAD
jgi:hypothetical protein